MTRNEIVEDLARRRVVEGMIENICRRSTPEMQDLAQIIYLDLLTAPAANIETAYEEGWLGFKLVRIIKNNWQSTHSRFRDLFTRYGVRAVDIDAAYDIADEDAAADTGSARRGGAICKDTE